MTSLHNLLSANFASNRYRILDTIRNLPCPIRILYEKNFEILLLDVKATAKPMDRRPKAAFVDKSLRVQGRFFSGDIPAFILY